MFIFISPTGADVWIQSFDGIRCRRSTLIYRRGLGRFASEALLVNHHAAMIGSDESVAVFSTGCELFPHDVHTHVDTVVVLEVIQPEKTTGFHDAFHDEQIIACGFHTIAADVFQLTSPIKRGVVLRYAKVGCGRDGDSYCRLSFPHYQIGQ